MDDVLARIRETVGPSGWCDDPAGMEPYLVEERGLYRGRALAVVRPASTDEVSRVVALCAQARLPITPMGGNTGLVGGGVAEGGIIIATDRMTRIREVDGTNYSITLEAGVILAHVQKAAEDAGAYFPLSLGAEGSCRIGGNLATNAGGVGVLRYGNARELALGLEVVLPDGRVWDGLRGLRKDNTGYALKHLFIGSEGTLGIITAARLKLFPRPTARETFMAGLVSVGAALRLFRLLRENLGDAISAFEIMPGIAMDFVTNHMEKIRDPLSSRHGWYVLAEVSGQDRGDGLRRTVEEALGQAFDLGVVEDAVIAESIDQAGALWRIRESIPEAQKFEGGSIKHDVALPISGLEKFVETASLAVEAAMPGVRVCAFGHIGDGNLHFNLSQPLAMDKAEFLGRWREMNRIVHDIAVAMGGTFSAEHGIGILKKDELAHYRSDVEIDLMRKLKRAIDPDGIMNPGKVIDI